MRGDAARRARGHAPGMPTACSSQGQGSPPWACSSQSQGSPHGQAAKAKAGPHGHAAAKAKACSRACCQGQGHGSPNVLAVKVKAKAMAAPMCLRGHAGMPLGARCLRGNGRTARAWHAPWVGYQGHGMPLGPLGGHGNTWGGCCCQAWIASSDTSYSSPSKERLGKNPLWHEETLTC